MIVDMPTNHHNHEKKFKSNIMHHDNHPTTQITIVQPLKRKETKHTLAHLCVFITYFWTILLWVDVGAGVGVSIASSVPWGAIQQEFLESSHQDHLAASSM